MQKTKKKSKSLGGGPWLGVTVEAFAINSNHKLFQQTLINGRFSTNCAENLKMTKSAISKKAKHTCLIFSNYSRTSFTLFKQTFLLVVLPFFKTTNSQCSLRNVWYLKQFRRRSLTFFSSIYFFQISPNFSLISSMVIILLSQQ